MEIPSATALPLGQISSTKRQNTENVKQTTRGLFYYNEPSDFKNKYCLTFDDGPNLTPYSVYDPTTGLTIQTTVTERILDILKNNQQQAVFFINGKNCFDAQGNILPKAKEILLRMMAEGHTLANHTYHHQNLATGKYADGRHDIQDIEQEIQLNQEALDRLLGFHYALKYFRPPYAEGGRTPSVDTAVQELGLDMIILQIDSFDWRIDEVPHWNKDKSLNHLREALKTKTGGTILLHDREKTIELLPELINILDNAKNAQGPYTPTSLDELVAIKYGENPVIAKIALK